jgi:hypothetical protein
MEKAAHRGNVVKDGSDFAFEIFAMLRRFDTQQSSGRLQCVLHAPEQQHIAALQLVWSFVLCNHGGSHMRMVQAVVFFLWQT